MNPGNPEDQSKSHLVFLTNRGIEDTGVDLDDVINAVHELTKAIYVLARDMQSIRSTTKELITAIGKEKK